MKTILYLIRHAQSHPTSRQHHSEWPLSSLGKNQALKLGILLEKLAITHIFSSPFTRCIQTVKPFADKSIIPIVIENDLRERLIANTIINGFYHLWCKSWEDFDFALPGCETSAQAQERFVKAVSKLADSNRGNIIALCTHGNVMGLFLNWIDQSAGRMVAERLRNPDVLRVTMSDEKFNWDKQFILPGLNSLSTDHNETPVEK
jgi:2,3-bisphosphoglycerate-dependent phosphoglycerate mutase